MSHRQIHANRQFHQQILYDMQYFFSCQNAAHPHTLRIGANMQYSKYFILYVPLKQLTLLRLRGKTHNINVSK